MHVRTRLHLGSRSLAIVGVFALLLALVPFGAALADHRVNTEEVEGGDDATSASVAWSEFTFDTATEAAIGRDDKFPDNLASSVIQGLSDAPLLLTSSNELEQEVADELERLGVEDVHVLGGDAAIDDSVVDELEDLGYDIHRDSGITRIETAIDIAATHAPNATEGLLVRAFGTASGDETQAWADALAAGGWAAAEGMPVFLTQTNELNDNLADYLADSDITNLTIIGGTSAVSQNVENQLEAMGIDVDRVSGPNRFATAIEVAEARGYDHAGEADTVILSEGQESDAWAGGFTAAAYSAQTDAPIVLSNGENIPPETEAWLAGANDGGTAAAPQAHGDTHLVCGPMVEPEACDEAADIMGLGEGSNVAVTTANAERGGNIQGTLSNPGNVQNLAVSGPCIDNDSDVDFNESTGAFSIPVRSDAASGTCTLTFTITYDDGSTETETVNVTITQPPTVTSRPELTNAQILSTTTTAQATAGNPAGTVVRYCFDEAVTGATAPAQALFHVYEWDGDVHNGNGGATIESTATNCVRVLFTNLDTAAEAAELTVAAVNPGAVTDNQGQSNAIGDAPIGSTTSTPFQAGRTDAPDLLTVQNFRANPATAGETLVDFTFDETAFTANPAGFRLVTTDGEIVVCAATTGAAGGQPTTAAGGTSTITAECTQTATTGPLTSTNVARGFVLENTVSDAFADVNTAPVAPTGNGNPLQASDTPDQNTVDPDLVSATFDNSDSTQDIVVYRFDEPVNLNAPAGGQFCVYQVDTDQVCNVAAGNITRGTDANTVVVTFPNNTLQNAVGASVQDGAVVGATGTAGRDNEPDEVGVANSNVTSRTAGRTNDPDLTGVRVEEATGATGTTARGVYTFDEDVAAPVVQNNFLLYQADGTVLICTDTTPAIGTTDETDNTVTCDQYAIADAAGNPSTVTATNAQVMNAVLGAVEAAAVASEDAGGSNPKGAEIVSGTRGTPQQ